MLLDSLAVILVRPRFPENIGMAARACANMGCPSLYLVAPERWDLLKAEPLATVRGMEILANLRIFPTLACAIAPFGAAWATTGRLGGFRRAATSPELAAREISGRASQGERIAIVFGPEDRGLENADLALCQGIITIPVEETARSLNLAQAVLLVLYECRKALQARPKGEAQERKRITCQELGLLEEKLREALVCLDCLNAENQEYFFQRWRRLLNRAQLRRHEYAALMGLCRQIMNRIAH